MSPSDPQSRLPAPAAGPAIGATVAVALRMNLRRLTTWVFAAVFLLIVYLLYRGPLRFGGMTASGAKLAVNSEYAIAAVLGAFSFFLMHFTATLIGDPVVKDARLGVASLLRATPVGRRTYLVGKFLGGYASLLTIYAIFLGALVLGQVLPASEDKLTLPFRLWPYMKFALLFVLVPTFFVGSLSFAIGTLTGSMKMVYIAVTALLVGWFLVVGALGDEQLRWLAYIEPSGQAWLAEKVARGRGNAWLNENPINPDLGLIVNRLVLLALGAGALASTLARWKGEERDAEFGGEVRPGRIERLLRWARGRQTTVADLYTNWVGRGSVPMVEPTARGPGTWLAQLVGSLATELRLLAAERSLWIMVPMIMLLAGVDSVSYAGPFNVRVYPVSSEFARQMVPTLLILLAGTTIFYTGEVFHRDDENGVRGILYASPIANSAMLLAKLFAMLLLSSAMVLLTVLTALISQAVQWYWIDGSLYLDLVPYGPILLRIVLPSVLVLCTTALCVNVLVRGRYVAYFACILLGAGYIWLLVDGRRSLLNNPLAIGHWSYSDLVGLGPYEERLGWHHLYWGALLTALIALSCWLLQRTQGGWRQYLSAHALRARPWGAVLALAFLAAALLVGREIEARGNVRGTRAQQERAQVALEERWGSMIGAPRLALRGVSIDVDLWPDRRSVDVRGELVLENPYPRAIERAVFTVDPLHEIRRFDLALAAGPYSLDESILSIPLERPVQPGERVRLAFDWGGVVGAGWSENGGPQGTFLLPQATFLSSFGAELLPLPGVDLSVFLSGRERRAEHGLKPFEPMRPPASDSYVPAVFGSDIAFDLDARIRAPAGQTVLCVGELVARVEEGERELHRFRTDHPVRTLAILAGDYEHLTEGDDEIWYHAAHTYNLPTIGAALADSRRFFGQRLGRYPHRQLRIAEFPRLASFAQSFPTLMPYSEAIGFLTHHRGDRRRVDVTYFVTAHEVAHQWWGYIASPGLAPGAQVLSESLAEYSAMVLIDQMRGERDRLVFLKQEEDRYLRQRDPDTEVPLSQLQLEGEEVWYNKGALVLYMLERQIGRERLLQGLASFVARWRDLDEEEFGKAAGAARASGHPTLRDLLDELHSAHRGEYLEWFYEQWFDAVIVPDMAFDSEPVLHDEGGTWTVEFSATNLGQGRLPVHVEALRGPWRPERGGSSEEELERGEPVLLWLEPGESTRGVVSARFQPEAIVIDRLYECLDFDRTNNARELGQPEARSTPAPSGTGTTRR